MKKIFALCATIALAMVVMTGVAQAQASGPFADVPTDHWAYTAVTTLQNAGIVIGYPDGTYGGKRALTRYEFAEAIARLLPLIKQPDLSPYAKTDDLTALQTQLSNELQQNQAALDALKNLVNEFTPELQQLGQDVAAIKTRLTALEQRVAVVEAEQKRVKINADINVIARANVESSGHGLVDADGYALGTNKSLFASPNVYNDVLLSITGQVSDTSTAVVQIDAGNYLQTLGNAESFDPASTRYTTPGSSSYDATGSEPFDIFRAYLDTPISFGAIGGGEAKVGRFGEQLTPYTFKAINPDSYASTPETETGDVSVDGANVGFNQGALGVQAFAGKESPISNETLAAGLNYAGARSGAFLPGSAFNAGGVITPTDQFIDQAAGVRATFGTPDTYTIGVTGLLARVNTVSGVSPIDPERDQPYNNLLVYGADYNGYIPGLVNTGLTFNGEFAVSATGNNAQFSSVDSTKGNEAIKAELGYTSGPFAIKGGYQNVYADYAAPGNWGHIGSWTNPTNIEGGLADASYQLSSSTKLVAGGDIYKGQYNVGSDNPLGKRDYLGDFNVGVKSALTSAYSVDLGYEYVRWTLHNDQGLLNQSGEPTEQYITIGIGHPINKNSDVRLAYQIIDYKSDGTDFEGGSPTNTGNAVGGVATTQFDFKF